MKYIAVLDTDDYEDFEFYEDGNGKYIHGIDAGSVNGEWIALYFTECEQEPMLDKIRAEIADIYCGQYCENPLTADAVREMALDIIDKYKAEGSEDEE